MERKDKEPEVLQPADPEGDQSKNNQPIDEQGLGSKAKKVRKSYHDEI